MPRFRLPHSRGNVRATKNPPHRKVSLLYYRPVRIPVVDSIKTEKRVLFKCATGKKTSERVEDKLVILEALEKNLIDYNKLRDQFVEIFEEIKQLNDPTTTS